MNSLFTRSLALTTLVGLAACSATSGTQVAVPQTTSVNPVAQSSLTFAVGTANVNGQVGLNVVATLRQPNGNSSVLVDSPTITGPFTLPATAGTTGSNNATAATGPSASEITQGGIITSTPQTQPGTPSSQITATTFGQSGGVFGLGFGPFNSKASASGSPSTYTPYVVPLYGDPSGTVVGFTQWGGPPAFDINGNLEGTRDGTFPSAELGTPEGITVFNNVTPSAGTYTLSVSIPTGFNGDTPTYSAISKTATLTAGTTPVLPVIAPPTITLDGTTGGGSFTQVFPAGVTEVYVQMQNRDGNCWAAPGPAYYTFRVRNTDAQPIAIPPNMGPAGAAGAKQSTFCTAAANTTAAGGTATPGDRYRAWAVGFNYSAYSFAYPFSRTQSPSVAIGPNGQDDITISARTSGVSP